MVSSMEILNCLNFFCQFYLIFRVFSKKYIAENVSPDYQDRSNFKNPESSQTELHLERKGVQYGPFSAAKTASNLNQMTPIKIPYFTFETERVNGPIL